MPLSAIVWCQKHSVFWVVCACVVIYQEFVITVS